MDDTLAKRVRLSKAVFPAVQIREDGIAEVQEVERGRWHEFDPYTNPADWMELEAWILRRLRVDCIFTSIEEDGLFHTSISMNHWPDLDFPKGKSEDLLTSKCDAVIDCLDAMEEKDGE